MTQRLPSSDRYASPSLSPTRETRTYTSMTATFDPSGCRSESQLVQVRDLDGYRVELIER